MSTSRQHTEAVMQGLASGVDSILNGDMKDPLNTGRKYGFVLLVAEFGDVAEGRVNYVSNGDKATMVAMLKEYLARPEVPCNECGGTGIIPLTVAQIIADHVAWAREHFWPEFNRRNGLE